MHELTNLSPASPRTALVLTGGGARAAYQVGVLKAVAQILPEPRRNPFPILCGTSAGAINAAVLACGAEDFKAAVDNVIDVWSNMRAGDVYRADALGVAASGARWLSTLAFGWLLRDNPRSLLDNSPLRRLIERHADFSGIARALESGSLYACSLTCSGYTSGQSVAFFQGHGELQSWEREQRVGANVRLSADHLLASSAIPFVFPAVRLRREWFGDGSMRQLAPISPAIHLGAERILIVAPGRMHEPKHQVRQDSYPTLAQIAGHALSSIFLDSLAVDIERLSRINTTLRAIGEKTRSDCGLPLRPVSTLVIGPSQRLDFLAARHAKALPWPVRALLRGVGAMNRKGGALTSYLLFEAPYTRALIDLGFADTMARAEEVRNFLLPTNERQA